MAATSSEKPLRHDELAEWEDKLKADGLSPLDERNGYRTFVRPLVCAPISSVQDDRKEFAGDYRWRRTDTELCWAFYCRGVKRAEISRILNRSPNWVKVNIYRAERQRKRKQATRAATGNEVLEEFVAAQYRFALPEPPSIAKYKSRQAINLWRPPEMSVSEEQIDAMLADQTEPAPKPELVLATDNGEPKPKTQEQLEQEKFDAVLAGPFTPEAMQTAAIDSFKARLPRFIENTERQIKHYAGRGAFEAELDSKGASNFQAGVIRHLKENKFNVFVRNDTLIVVELVPGGVAKVAAGEL